MRILLAAAVCGSLLSLNAFGRDRLDGCGLGWEITDKKTYTATTTRGTTNAFVPPTFGMTTGTLGCDQLEVGAVDREGSNFVATNFHQLRSELATGQGEYVTGMADSMGCAAHAKALGSHLQSHYDQIVAPTQNAVELYSAIKSASQGICI